MQSPTLLRFAFLIAVRRTAADWRLQAAAGFGMVLAVALMASAVIYSNALRETALRFTLRNVTTEQLDISIGLFHALERPAFEATDAYVRAHLQHPVEPYLEGSALFIRTSTFFFTGSPQLDLPASQRPRGPIQGVTDLGDHVRMVAGRLPQAAQGELELIVDPLGASLLGLEVGQQFDIFPALLEDRQERTMSVRVVGIFEPLDPQEKYWQIGFPKRFANAEGQWATVPFYADTQELFNTLGTTFLGLNSDFFWFFFLDREGLRADGADALRKIIPASRADIFTNNPTASWETDLESVLDRYAFLLLLAQIPLFMLVFLAIGVLLYYIFLIAGLLGRVRAPEVALFRSRGASMPQVGLVILIEGLLLAIPAVVVGPFLAQALVVLTGSLFPAVSGGSGLSFVNLSPTVFLLGSVGAFLAVAVLSITTLSTSRHGVVELRRASARPPQMPFLHRYYLDLALLALIGMLWFQLKSRDSPLLLPLFGEDLEIDWALLLSPVLGVVAVGLVLFRLFPLVMRSIAWPADQVVPVWLAQGLRRVARDPVPAGSMLVLIALATSLGVLASTFTATLERSQRDQALYEAGADLRIRYTLQGKMAEGPGLAATLASLPGVAAATDVIRPGSGLIAVDPETFVQAAWYRPDFASAPLAQVLEKLQPENAASTGIPLPTDTTSLGVWVDSGRLTSGFRLMARLRDSQGFYFASNLGVINDQGWRYLEAPISPMDFRRAQTVSEEPFYTPVPPYSLHAMWVASISGSTGALFFDQLQAITPSGPVELASFQDLDGWHPLEDAGAPGLYALEISSSVGRTDRRSAALTWGEGEIDPGLRTGPPHTPLPILVSPSFITKYQAQVGDELVRPAGDVPVPLKIVGVMDYLPTIDPNSRPFLVIDLVSLLEYTSLRSPRTIDVAREVWLSSAGETLPKQQILQAIQASGGKVTEVSDAAEDVAARTADPLLAAGWSGLLALSFVTVVLASSSGLILYTYIDARERGEEFALLRTMGFSRLQVNGVLWFNLALVVLFGVAVGTWGGQWLGSALLPLLEVAEAGTRVTPPMVLETNWVALGAAYAVLMAAALATVAALAWAISHLDVQRVLRAGGA